MTKAEFIENFGPEWRKLSEKPIIQALFSVIDEEHPIRTEPVAEGDKLHGAPVYLNRAYGYDSLRKLLVSLSTEQTEPFEPPDKFRESEM